MIKNTSKNGLECILSDQVTRETKICANTHFISLDEKKWVVKQDVYQDLYVGNKDMSPR